MKIRRFEDYGNSVQRLYCRDLPETRSACRNITFQVTSGCNLRCAYCYEHHKSTEHMSIETGQKIIDYLLGLYRPVSNVSAPEERFFGSYSESLIPVIGTVKAGYGALAFEEDYGQEYARVKDPSNYFYLVVRGDSMEPRIQDGDLALVHKQDTLENGDLGVLIYGDEGEGTLKRYIQRGNCVVLQPFNPAYSEMVIKGEDLNHLHIAGRVVETKAKW